jgi:hypothetical protein
MYGIGFVDSVLNIDGVADTPDVTQFAAFPADRVLERTLGPTVVSTTTMAGSGIRTRRWFVVLYGGTPGPVDVVWIFWLPCSA